MSREEKGVAGDKVGQRDLGADMRSYREETKMRMRATAAKWRPAATGPEPGLRELRGAALKRADLAARASQFFCLYFH